MKAVWFIVFLFLLNEIGAQTWIPVGKTTISEGEAFDQVIALDGETPYVAFMDRANGDKATVMKYNGTSWETLGSAGFTSGKAESISFAVKNGIPYVAFSDETNGYKASVMKFNGSEWTYAGAAGFSPSTADAVCLAFGNETSYVAFEDGNNSKVTVMKLDGGSWSIVGETGFSTGWMTNVVALAVEGNTPYVAYRDYGADYKASVMKFNGTNWELMGTEGFSERTHDAYQCLAVYGGTPYVASWNADANAGVYQFDSNAWKILGTPNVSDDQVSSQSIVFSKNGTLFLTFSDWGNSKKVKVVKYDENNWSSLGEYASQGEATYISIAVSDKGIPYVAYRDNYNMRRTTVMKYDAATGTENSIENGNLRIYPNPVNSCFHIELPAGISGCTLKIINMNGQIIYSNNHYTSNQQIDLSKESKGIYLIKAQSKFQPFFRKIVKK